MIGIPQAVAAVAVAAVAAAAAVVDEGKHRTVGFYS